jgi:hypothetical protein
MSLMTACVLSAVTPLRVAAADLDGERYAEPPYDERGYGDERGYADDRGYADERDRQPYEDGGFEAAEPRAGSIKDGYPVPMPPPRAEALPPPRYVERPPVRVERYACLQRWQIRDRLRHEGWFRIRPMGGDGEVVHIRARRHDSGRPFDLRIDRCSGAVLAARPEYLRSFAYEDRPWRRGY